MDSGSAAGVYPVRISVWPILPLAQEDKGVGVLCLRRPTALAFVLASL